MSWRTAGGGRLRVPRRAALAGAAALLGVAAAPGLTGAARGASSASVTENIAVAPMIRSVTVTPSTVTLSNCTDDGGANPTSQLTFPDGACRAAGTVTVTNNGTSSEQIEASAGSATPADNGTPWALCTPTGTHAADGTCAGGPATPPGTPAGFLSPGQDQFAETNGSLWLTGSPQCDTSFATCTAVVPGGAHQETPELLGPSSSTDSSSSFTTTITWTAV